MWTIIDRLGGADAAARLTGVGTEAVRKWRQAGSIPVAPLGGGDRRDRPGPVRPARRTGRTARRSDRLTTATTVPTGATAALVLADGAVFWGRGFGAHTGVPAPVGEVCFNTGMTGYQETLTDPSYAGQIITFTFPHIGNVGTNAEDIEAATIAARGLVVKQDVTEPSNWRSAQHLDAWLRARGIAGVAGVDTRALTVRIRDGGAPNGVLAFPADGRFDLPALRAQAEAWPGLEGMDLAKEVSCRQSYEWDETRWAWPDGRRAADRAEAPRGGGRLRGEAQHPALPGLGRMPGDGGAGDGDRRRHSAATTRTACSCPTGRAIRRRPANTRCRRSAACWRRACRCSASASAISCWRWRSGRRTYKLDRGHRGANQPVKDLATGKVEITSQNHGFAVDAETLPATAKVTHVSLFDGSNEGLACTDRPAFSVQYHPEASPGPSDSHYLFERFVEMIERRA